MKSLIHFLICLLPLLSVTHAKEDFLIRGYEYAANKEELQAFTENEDVVVVINSVSKCNTCPIKAENRKDGEDIAKKIAKELKGEVPLLYWPYRLGKERFSTLGFSPPSLAEQKKKYSVISFAYNPKTSKILEEGAMYPEDASSKEKRESIEDFIARVRKAKEEASTTENDTKEEEVNTESTEASMVVKSASGKSIEIIPLELSDEENLKYLYEGKERSVKLSQFSENSAEEVRAYFIK